MKYLNWFWLIVVPFLFNSCNTKCPHSAKFIIPVTFTPQDSIIKLGDTITITSYFPNKIRAENSDEIFIFDSINFYLSSGFHKIDTFNGSQIIKTTRDAVDIIIEEEKYNFKMLNYGFRCEFYYIENEYFIQFKAIPKYKGVYYFGFGSQLTQPETSFPRNQFISSESFDCEISKFYPHMITNDGKGNNKELLKLSPDWNFRGTYYRNWDNLSQNGGAGAHCFKVE